VKATDAAGNTSDPATYGFDVDATAPTVSIDSGPSGTVGTDSATFTFSSESGAKLECSLDGASFGSCASPKNYTGLQDGSHTFGVRATDNAGNVSQTSSRSWTVDAASVIMAAGNIACNATTTKTDICRQMSTSDLLVNNAPDAVLPLGDDQYECGYLKDFNKYYGASWGRMKAITHPIPGNHEYSTSTTSTDPCYNAPSGAPGYFQYFGNAASPTEPGCTANCKGYYSYDLGSWHIVALNSICSQVGGCGKGSPQEVWLRNDLAAHPTQCTLAYWHYPRFSSSEAGSTYTTYLQTLWQDLYNAKVEVVLNAHDHIYERFAPMDTLGNLDRANGVRQFTVGTGGKKHMSIVNIHPNSEVRNTDTYGVLKMNLRPTGYDWNFMPIAGSTFTDSGSDSCH
jgi:acid phosphatase type 7